MRPQDAKAMFSLAQTVLNNMDNIPNEELESLKYVWNNTTQEAKDWIANNCHQVRSEISHRLRG